MKIHVYKSKESMSYELALWICNNISETLKSQNYFSLVLSGGNTPKTLFEELSSPFLIDKIDWKKVNIFWGDERFVPFSDERNNARMAFDILIDKINIPKEQVHRIPTDIDPSEAAKKYQQTIKNYFEGKQKSFDLVLLGIGDDGHTLSLFPHSPILSDEKNWVNKVYNDEQKMFRITLMPSLVNQSKEIVFMVEGTKKAAVLNKILEGKYEPEKYPSQLIKAENGEIHWFLDKEAASKIKDIQNSFGHIL